MTPLGAKVPESPLGNRYDEMDALSDADLVLLGFLVDDGDAAGGRPRPSARLLVRPEDPKVQRLVRAKRRRID